MQDVGAWMTKDPVVIEVGASALEVLDQMLEGDFRHTPVVNDSGVLIGILTVDDLRAGLPYDVNPRVAILPGRRAEMLEYRVGDLMTHLPICVRARTPLQEAVGLLILHRIGALPVVDGRGVPIGILTETDALRALQTSLEQTEGSVTARRPAAEYELLLAELRAEQQRIRRALTRGTETERLVAAAQHGEPMDVVDRGAWTSEGTLAGTMVEFATRRLSAIDRALERHAQGTFGVCEGCGAAISRARLRAMPSAGHCLRCAARQEREQEGGRGCQA